MTTAAVLERTAPHAQAASEIDVGIRGMTCASCVHRVEQSIAAVPGVTDVSVNLATETARVAFAEPTPNIRGVVNAIARAGYEAERAEFDLRVEGMTCASCVGRVEKALGRVPGVTEASVNLATGRAHVVGHAAEVDELVAAVDDAGYKTRPVAEKQAATAAPDAAQARSRREFGHVLIAAALSLPLVLGMVGDLLDLGLMPPGWV